MLCLCCVLDVFLLCIVHCVFLCLPSLVLCGMFACCVFCLVYVVYVAFDLVVVVYALCLVWFIVFCGVVGRC